MAEVGLVALPMTFVIITGGIDLSVGSILGLVAILLGVFWQKLGLPLPLAIVLGVVVGGVAGLVNGIDHHPLPRAAADRDAGDAGALSRPRRGHQPGALGARLSRMVLRARPGRGAGRADPALDPARLRRRRRDRARHARPSAAPPTPSATTRPRRASPAFRSTAPSSLIYTRLRPDRRPRRRSIFVSRVSTTRSDMGTGLELDVITAVVLGGTAIFGGARHHHRHRARA